jgi:hypothetical protein
MAFFIVQTIGFDEGNDADCVYFMPEVGLLRGAA